MLSGMAEAGTRVSNGKYKGASMWKKIDSDTTMSWAVWRASGEIAERHGGSPEKNKYDYTGYCFYVVTCPKAIDACRFDKEVCGVLGPDDLRVIGDAIHIAKDGFVFDCSVDRRGHSSSTNRVVRFDGSSEELYSEYRTTRGTGALTGVEGAFQGDCYSDDGISREKIVN